MGTPRAMCAHPNAPIKKSPKPSALYRSLAWVLAPAAMLGLGMAVLTPSSANAQAWHTGGCERLPATIDWTRFPNDAALHCRSMTMNGGSVFHDYAKGDQNANAVTRLRAGYIEGKQAKTFGPLSSTPAAIEQMAAALAQFGGFSTKVSVGNTLTASPDNLVFTFTVGAFAHCVAFNARYFPVGEAKDSFNGIFTGFHCQKAEIADAATLWQAGKLWRPASYVPGDAGEPAPVPAWSNRQVARPDGGTVPKFDPSRLHELRLPARDFRVFTQASNLGWCRGGGHDFLLVRSGGAPLSPKAATQSIQTVALMLGRECEAMRTQGATFVVAGEALDKIEAWATARRASWRGDAQLEVSYTPLPTELARTYQAPVLDLPIALDGRPTKDFPLSDPYEAACWKIGGWVGRYNALKDFAASEAAGRRYGAGGFQQLQANMFLDEEFVPVFGRPYETLNATVLLSLQSLLTTCHRYSVSRRFYPAGETYLMHMFMLERARRLEAQAAGRRANPTPGDQWIEARRNDRAALDQALALLETTAPDQDAFARQIQAARQVEQSAAKLLPPHFDQAPAQAKERLAASANARADEIAGGIEAVKADDRAAVQGLFQQLAAISPHLTEESRAALGDRLKVTVERKAGEIAARVIAELQQLPDNAETISPLVEAVSEGARDMASWTGSRLDSPAWRSVQAAADEKLSRLEPSMNDALASLEPNEDSLRRLSVVGANLRDASQATRSAAAGRMFELVAARHADLKQAIWRNACLAHYNSASLDIASVEIGVHAREAEVPFVDFICKQRDKGLTLVEISGGGWFSSAMTLTFERNGSVVRYELATVKLGGSERLVGVKAGDLSGLRPISTDEWLGLIGQN